MTAILLVDDMELFREPIAAALRSRGFDVCTAGDGHAALRLARNQPPDLVLLDLAMPGMDGLSVLGVMRGDPRLHDLPVILLTAVADRDYVIRAAKLGAKHYLLKTQFSIDQLIARVKTVLAERALALEQPSRPPGDCEAAGGAVTGATKSRTPAESTDDAREADRETLDSPAARLKTMRPLLKRSEMYDRIDGTGELHALSPTVSKVIRLTEQESSTAEDIAKVIRQDSAVAIKILRLANSVAFSRGQLVDTLDKAVARLGIAAVRQAMLNLNVIEKFGATNLCGDVNIGRFWEHSIGCGIIAAQLARHRGEEDSELAFTMGLVHDLGRLLFMQELGETYGQVLETARNLGLPLEQVESRLLMVTHAEVMDRLLHAWHFPKELIDPVVFHHLPVADIQHMAPKRFNEVVALALADRLCHALLIGDSGNRVLYPIAEYCGALGLDGEAISNVVETASNETSELKLALLAESSGGAWADAREEVRAQLPGEFHPLVVSEQPVFDPIRIWCGQLGDGVNEAPNLAIVHASSPETVPMLLDRLGQLEREEGVSGLPLLILLPEGAAQLDARLMRRQHKQLRIPLLESTLVESIKNLLEPSASNQAA